MGMSAVLGWLKKYWWIILIGVVVGGLWYRNVEAKKTKLLKEKTFTVTKKDLVDSLTIAGEIDAKEKVSLKFQTSGLLTWVGVKEGDTVKKFQTIASLDKRELQNSMSQLLNTYSKTRSDFEQAQSDNKNWETNGMTDVAREAIKRTLSKEQMDLNNSVLAVEARDLSLKFASLYTPIAGLVTKVDSPVAGQNITPSTATFEVINPKSLYFSALADQSEVTKFKVGQKGYITMDSFSDHKIGATVESIAFTPKAGETGTVYELKIIMDKEGTDSGEIRLGMTGDVEFVFKEIKDVVAIPSAYIKKEGNVNSVTVMKNNKQEKRDVIIGANIDGTVEIISGLQENEVLYSN
jgi:RND family efflux transporter MFP subunit